MALQLGALRDALIDAGASLGKADRAAEEVASYDRELSDISADLRTVKQDVAETKGDIKLLKANQADTSSDVKLLKAMNAILMAMVAAILLRLFIH